MAVNSDLLRGALEPVVLEVIAAGSSYGYEISRAIQAASEGALLAQEGTLYPALHRLEKRGFLRAEWTASPEGRQRKHYRLTAAGRKRLEKLRSEWASFAGAVSRILGTDMQDSYRSDAGGAQGRDANAEIAAEIADHLATAAAALARQGADPADARQIAAERFGDSQEIQRRCWWIQQGDAVMMRAVGVTLAVVLCLALVAAGFGGWRLNSRLEELNLTLLELSKKQLAPERAASHSPEITGYCFLKDRSQPAAEAELELRQLPSLEVIRRLRTDSQGRFHSGPLVAGDYCLLAPLVGAENPVVQCQEPAAQGESRPPANKPLYWIQTEPFYLRDNLGADPIELDLHFACGFVSVALVSELPEKIEVIVAPTQQDLAAGRNKFQAQSQTVTVYLTVADELSNLPLRPRDPLPRRWPAIGRISPYYNLSTSLSVDRSAKPTELGQFPGAKHAGLPPGTYRISAQLGALMGPGMGGMGGGMGGMGGGGGFFNVKDDRAEDNAADEDETRATTGSGMGHAPTPIEVTVRDGETTRVEVRFPKDAAERLHARTEQISKGIYPPPVTAELKVVSRDDAP